MSIKVGDRVAMKDPLDEEEGELLAIRGDVAWVQFEGREEPENIAVQSLQSGHLLKERDRVWHLDDVLRKRWGLGTVESVLRVPSGMRYVWVTFDVDPNQPRSIVSPALELFREEPPFKVGDRVRAKATSGAWFPEVPKGVVTGIDGTQVWGRTDSGKYFTAEAAKLVLE